MPSEEDPSTFCNTDYTCYAELVGFLLPYWIFLLFCGPLRYSEVVASAICATPKKLPRIHLAKRVLLLTLCGISFLLFCGCVAHYGFFE
ncbi:unnamed protein product, partial [Amoebophrya sp. A25]|eukprot:GSA25T00022612001.1